MTVPLARQTSRPAVGLVHAQRGEGADALSTTFW